MKKWAKEVSSAANPKGAMDIVLLSAEPDEHVPDIVEYRYAIGSVEFSFYQRISNGNVWNVNIKHSDESLQQYDKLHDFDFIVDEGGAQDFYPQAFYIAAHSPAWFDVVEAEKFMSGMQKAHDILAQIENFFKTSDHYHLYTKNHNKN